MPYVAPLCPAGHLPRKGGDQRSERLSPIADVAGQAAAPKQLISPLAGEMSGRTEGGNVERRSLLPSIEFAESFSPKPAFA